jgi:serine protease Do
MNGTSPRPGRGRTLALTAVLLAGTALAGGWAWTRPAGAAEPEAPAPATASLHLPPVANPAGFAPLVKTVRPAVVNIATTETVHKTEMQGMPDFPPGSPFGDMFRQFFNQQSARPEHALGSGFIIDPAGYIVTNNHVVDGASKITVTLEDGRNIPAKVVGRDPKTDLALLKIQADKPLPYVAFGDSDQAQVGDWVIAVGNPFGLGGTVTAGIISAHGRNINEGPYDNFLQIDAPINPGNSGGPLFNQSGQVIGIDTAIYSPSGGSVGIGFAIPSNIISKVVAQLRDHGHVERGWLGVEMQSMSPQLAKAVGYTGSGGVLVDQVSDDSPAAHAGLKQGDVIMAFNGTAITAPRDLALAVADTPAGKTVPIKIWRDHGEHTLDVDVGSQPKDMDQSGGGASESGSVGMSLEPLTAEQRANMGLPPSARGVIVAQVAPGSRADDSGIQAGDLIVKVGDTDVTAPAQVAARIHAAEHEKKEALPLLINRNGTTYYLALQLTKE